MSCTIELGDFDSAIVFRAEGKHDVKSEEINVPQTAEGEYMPQSAIRAMMCIIALCDEQCRAIIERILTEARKQ